MTLKGEARTKYMRDYMRKRRAGLPTAKSEKPAPMSKEMEKLEAKLAKCEAKLAAAKAPAWGNAVSSRRSLSASDRKPLQNF